MNERRNELVEEVEGFLLEMWEKGRCDEPFTLPLASDRIIALVTEHRDAEIREALNTVPWDAIATDVFIADEYGGNYDDLLSQVTDAIWVAQEAALSRIGLAEKGAER